MVDNAKSSPHKMPARCGNNCRKDATHGIKEGWGTRTWEALLESPAVSNSQPALHWYCHRNVTQVPRRNWDSNTWLKDSLTVRWTTGILLPHNEQSSPGSMLTKQRPERQSKFALLNNQNENSCPVTILSNKPTEIRSWITLVSPHTSQAGHSLAFN